LADLNKASSIHAVNSASIEVNRRARRAKTDRLDSDKLLSMLMRCYAAERQVWLVKVLRSKCVNVERARTAE